MTDAKKAAPKAKPIIDVSHPGKTAPAANSKSVIINSRPLLKDPMVVTNEDTDQKDNSSDSSLAAISNKSRPHPLTAPLLETEEPDPPATDPAKPEPDKPEEPATKPDEKSDAAPEAKPADAEAPAKEPEPEPKSKSDAAPEAEKPAEPEKPAESKEPEQSDKPDQPAQPTPAGKADDKPAEPDSKPGAANADETAAQPKNKDTDAAKAEADKAAQHQAAIEKLADSKKYYLRINAVEKRRSRRFVILGLLLSLLLALAWVDIALDAGIIQINNVKPLTHFFSN